MIVTAVSSVQRKEIRRKGVCSTDTADTLSKKGWTAESESIKHLRTRNRKLRKSVRYIVGASENSKKSSSTTVSLNDNSPKENKR